MKFSEIVKAASELLRDSGRISYVALQMEFDLSDKQLEALKAELIKAKRLAVLVRDVLHEDALAHEAIHSGLASKVKTQLFFQDEEIQLRHFHRKQS